MMGGIVLVLAVCIGGYLLTRSRNSSASVVANQSVLPTATENTETSGITVATTSKSGSNIVNAKFSIWKTIELGTYKDGDTIRVALKGKGFIVLSNADMFGQPSFVVSKTRTEVNLVNVSARELGFTNLATRPEIYKRAQELGLVLCPPEVGPLLRIDYKDQPKDDLLLIAMEPIGYSGGPRVFSLGNTIFFAAPDGLWLGGGDGSPEGKWDINKRWVFVLPN